MAEFHRPFPTTPSEAEPEEVFRDWDEITIIPTALRHADTCPAATWLDNPHGNDPAYCNCGVFLSDEDVLNEMDNDTRQMIADGRLDRDYEIEQWRALDEHQHSFPLSTGICECGVVHPLLGPPREKA